MQNERLSRASQCRAGWGQDCRRALWGSRIARDGCGWFVVALAHLQMFGTEVFFGAGAPGTNEIVVQASAHYGTEYGNYSSCPLLDNLRACRYCNALDDARHELVDEFLFDKFATDIDAGSAGSGDPQFGDLFVAVEFEAVDEAEFLNSA